MNRIKGFDDFSGHLYEGTGDKIWQSFTGFIKRLFTKKTTPLKPAPQKIPPQIVGEHMLYLPHQQGPSGAAQLVRIAKGTEKLTPALRSKLLNNMPSSDPRYLKVKTGKDKEAVLSFLDYQKSTWGNYQKEALSKINQKPNTVVKEAIDKIQNKELPTNFLTTVAYKESRFNPNPKTNTAYRGLFQIGDSAWKQLKRINPSKYKGSKAPVNPKLNAQAGHDYLKWSYEQFEKLV